MKSGTEESHQALLERGIAELRVAYPRITVCHGALQAIREGAQVGYSLWLEVHWPERQAIVRGPVRETAATALQAALRKAREILEPSMRGPGSMPSTLFH